MSAIIHYPEAEITDMDPWVKNQHTKSGLLKAVAESTTDLATIEQTFYDALKPYCVPGKTFLAGNTVYQDRIFLKRYMPKIDSLFHYRLVDVSTLKELVTKWYPSDPHIDFKKNKDHRALADIHESMAELAHYRTYFFKK
jgi:oligoribonuclease